MTDSGAERAARRIADESCNSSTGIVPVPRMAAIIREETGTQWILVGERLPEQGDEVIVLLDADGDSPRETSTDYINFAGKWHDHVDKYVLAWQPLPAAPDEGGTK